MERLGEAIAERSPGDLRPVTANTPEEVEALVAAINSFMGRLQTALEGLRNFTGNASHQLRTPLAVVRTQLALIDRSESPAQTATASDKAGDVADKARDAAADAKNAAADKAAEVKADAQAKVADVKADATKAANDVKGAARDAKKS